MPIYERGGAFLVSVGSGKGRFRGSAKTRAEAEAIELQEMLNRKDPAKRQEAARAASGPGKGKTLKDAYDLAMRLHWRGEKSEKTSAINSNAVLEALGKDTLLSDITEEDITEMILEFEERGNSGSTVNRKTSAYNTIMKTAQSQKWLTDYPKPIRRKEGKHRIRWMDAKEEAHALSLAEHLGLYDLKDYIVVAVDTGFRRAELLGFSSKDFANGLLHLHAGATKNDEARAVPATKRVSEILKRRANYERPFEMLPAHLLRYQWDQLRGLMELDEDGQFVVHMLRHTCASRMVQKGVPLPMIQKWMGHRNIATTMRYAHLAPDSLLVARDALEGKA